MIAGTTEAPGGARAADGIPSRWTAHGSRMARVAALFLAGLVPCAGALAPTGLGAQETPDTLPGWVTDEAMRAGYDLFQSGSCRRCHGDAARGGLVGGPDLRDAEWLHSVGDPEGIFQTIRWGVRAGEVKAMTRPWEMRPRGGMLLDTQQMRSVAAYLWGQANGRFERSEEDRFVDLAFTHSGDEIRAAYRRSVASESPPPFEPVRWADVVRDLFNTGRPDAARAAGEIGVDAYPGSAILHFRLGQVLVLAGERERGLASVGRALELDPDLEAARAFLEQQGGR